MVERPTRESGTVCQNANAFKASHRKQRWQLLLVVLLFYAIICCFVVPTT